MRVVCIFAIVGALTVTASGEFISLQPAERTTYTLLSRPLALSSISSQAMSPELVPILNSIVSAPIICSFLLSQECTKIVLPSWQVPRLPPKTSETRPVEQPPPKEKNIILTWPHQPGFGHICDPNRHQEEVSNRQDKSDEKLVISAVAQRQTDNELSGEHSEKDTRNVRKR
ncbi:hypothetical protein RUM44_002548 [Polyplax serrata]|uniref:Uncharacterized protein n=1 Tax=Polyplax serrata TaxID=468196 RepID=A0ABR1AF37_POLSC